MQGHLDGFLAGKRRQKRSRCEDFDSGRIPRVSVDQDVKGTVECSEADEEITDAADSRLVGRENRSSVAFLACESTRQIAQNDMEFNFDTYLAGAKYYPGRDWAEDNHVVFRREEDNRKDPNAIQVLLQSEKSVVDVVGHLPAFAAAKLAPLVDLGVASLDGGMITGTITASALPPLKVTVRCNATDDPVAKANVGKRVLLTCRMHQL